MKLIDADHFELSTGKVFYACLGQLSVDEDDEDLFYGFDGRVLQYDEDDEDLFYGFDGRVLQYDKDAKSFTKEERAEIAEYMIARWRAWSLL